MPKNISASGGAGKKSGKSTARAARAVRYVDELDDAAFSALMADAEAFVPGSGKSARERRRETQAIRKLLERGASAASVIAWFNERGMKVSARLVAQERRSLKAIEGGAPIAPKPAASTPVRAPRAPHHNDGYEG